MLIPKPNIRLLVSQYSKGVTLLEIMVVLLIVAILFILLLPVLNSIKSASATPRCQANLRKIAVALHSYIGDHNGEYPPNRANYVTEGGPPYVFQVLQKGGYLSHNGSDDPRFATWRPTETFGGDSPYKKAGAWYCPSDTDRPPMFADMSYGQNESLGADDRNGQENPSWKPWQGKPVTDERSSGLIYLVDHDDNTEPKTWGGGLHVGSWPLGHHGVAVEETGIPKNGMGISFRHSGKIANALFVDGSVRALRFDDLANTKTRYLRIPDN